MCSPEGIRTLVADLRSQSPRPLDDGALECYSVVLELISSIAPTIARTIAGVPGLEPRLNEPESLGLPITPYPTKIDALTPIPEGLRIAELLASFERQFAP